MLPGLKRSIYSLISLNSKITLFLCHVHFYAVSLTLVRQLKKVTLRFIVDENGHTNLKLKFGLI